MLFAWQHGNHLLTAGLSFSILNLGYSRPDQANGDVSGHTNGSGLRTEKEKQSWSQLGGGDASGVQSNNPKKPLYKQSPPSLKSMADRSSSEVHFATLPKVRHDDNVEASWPGIAHPNPENLIDNINQDHRLEHTQSMPVWMPSVVATTISEDAEEQAFEKIDNISLDQLRDDVDKAYSPPHPGNESSSGMIFCYFLSRHVFFG